MGSVVRLREVPQRHTPVRRPNHELRTREHLTEREVEKLIEAAKGNRWGHRDATMILIAYRHGLRTSELVDLRWDQVHLTSAILDVRRKNDSPATHPLTGLELRALRRLKREQDPSPFVFTSQRGDPFSTGLRPHVAARWAGRRADFTPSSSAYAAARHWLQARQRRARHESDPGLARTQKQAARGALHRNGAEPIPKFLAGLTTRHQHICETWRYCAGFERLPYVTRRRRTAWLGM